MNERLKNTPTDNISPPNEFDVDKFRAFILQSEEWLMDQILFYAKRQDYSRYTSTLKEAWRLSISGLSNALLSSITEDSRNLELYPDEDYTIDPAASFGVLEAKRHRARGINLSMFLGLMKYYRQSYLDLINNTESPGPYKAACKLRVERFFDRIELGFCSEWCTQTENSKLEELQNKNREIINEKNRYLTIFETIHAPVVLINDKNRVENYNQAWAELFEESSVPGSKYYNEDSSFFKKIPWFVDVFPYMDNNISDYVLEKDAGNKKKGRNFFT